MWESLAIVTYEATAYIVPKVKSELCTCWITVAIISNHYCFKEHHAQTYFQILYSYS